MRTTLNSFLGIVQKVSLNNIWHDSTSRLCQKIKQPFPIRSKFKQLRNNNFKAIFVVELNSLSGELKNWSCLSTKKGEFVTWPSRVRGCICYTGKEHIVSNITTCLSLHKILNMQPFVFVLNK